MIKLNAAVLTILIIAQPAIAADFPTRMATMGNEDLGIIDSMNGRCSSDDGGENLNCTFTTVAIDYKLPAADLDSHVDAFIQRATQLDSLDEEISGVFSPDGLCGGAFLDRLDDTGRGLLGEYRQRLNNFCEAEASEAAARDVLRLEAEVQSRTCLVWADSGGVDLSRAEAGRWTVQGEPSGSCDVYDIVELSCDDSMYHCDYDEHAIYGNTEGEFCAGFSGVEDEGDHYSWQVARVRELNCDFVQLWFE